MPPRALITATALLALATPDAAVAATRWQRPLDDRIVVRSFAYDARAPFAAGQRRGIDLAAPPGARVGAVCGGTVTHAGRVPQRRDGVTLRCADGLVATELGLTRLTVARGERVAAGTPIGRLAAAGVLRIGARRPAGRDRYIDPAPLFGEDPPPVAPPAGVRARRRPAAEPRGPAPAPRVVSAGRPVQSPWPVLAGLGLLATATTGATLARRRRAPRRRGAAEIPVLQR